MALRAGNVAAGKSNVLHETANPLVFKKAERVIIWREPDNKLALDLVRAAQKERHPPGPLATIEVAHDVPRVTSMLQLIESPIRQDDLLTAAFESYNLLVVVDPSSNLPGLAAFQWPLTRSVLVLSTPPEESLDPTLYDVLITLPEADRTPSRFREEIPLTFGCPDIQSVPTQLRTYIASIAEPAMPYFYSIKGPDQGLQPSLAVARATDVVIIGAPPTDPLSITTFRQRAEDVVAHADQILIHSRFVYQYEDWILRGETLRIVLRLAALGARIQYLPAAETAPPGGALL